MAYDTRELAVRITGDAADFVKVSGQVQKSSDDAESGLQKFADGSKKAAIALAGAGVGLTAYAKNATDYTTDLVKSSKEMSRETGVTVEQGSQLIYVAQRMGISADQASQVFGKFSKSISSAADDAKNAGQVQAELQDKIEATKLQIQQTTAEIQKNGDKTGDLSLKVKTLNTDLNGLESQVKQSSNSFQKLGIDVLDAQGNTKDFNTLLLESADKFKSMKDGTEKTTLAMDLFGKSGKDMLPILNQGSQGIKDLEAKADSLGLTLNAKTIGSIEKYISSQKDLTDSTNSLKVQVGSLTAPILTSFNLKVNQATSALISMHNPLHTAVIDTLAFGGPIAGVTSALFGFTSNLATTIEALGGFRAAMTALGVFMTGPFGIALAGLGTALAAVAIHFFTSKSNADQLSQSTEKLKTDTDSLKQSQDSLAQTQLNEQQATLAVQQAQESYNDAVAQFGPNSTQAQQALIDLKQAQLNVKQAHEDTITAMDNYHKKEKEVADDKSLIQHLKDISGNLDEAQQKAFVTTKTIEGLNGAKIMTQTLKDAKGNPITTFTSTLPHNAQGTDSWSGGPTWVGEQGPEIVVPPKGSAIIPADKSSKIATQTQNSPSNTNSGSYVTLNVNVGMYAGMPVEKRQIALELYKELVRAARSQGVNLPMIGAVGVQ